MLLLKGDKVRLHSGEVVEIIAVWGFARCHAKARSVNGKILLLIAERDVNEVVKRVMRKG